MLLFGLGENAVRAAAVQGVKDLCIPEPPSQNTLPGGNTGLRLPPPPGRRIHHLNMLVFMVITQILQ
jgi:hypothetical protein